ncbi:MAG: hypothetical protein ABR502_03055 [Chitinophagaceae bacterium]
MKYCIYKLLLVLLLCSCNNSNRTATDTKASDTTMQSIDSSAIINDATRLPNDSTTTGVTH